MDKFEPITGSEVIECNSFPPLPTAYDILHMVLPDPVWIVPGYIPAGLAILAARPKIGKSWLAMQICKGIVSGGRIFDQEIVQGRVLYLALEDPIRRLQSRLQIQGWNDEHAKMLPSWLRINSGNISGT